MCFERFAFAKAVWVKFTLRLLLSVVPFVVNVLRMFLAEAQGSLRLDVFYVYSLCFEASLSQRTMCVNLRFALCVLM